MKKPDGSSCCKTSHYNVLRTKKNLGQLSLTIPNRQPHRHCQTYFSWMVDVLWGHQPQEVAVSKSWVVEWIIISVVVSNIFFIFTPTWKKIIQFDEHIFRIGWNHQLVYRCGCKSPSFKASASHRASSRILGWMGCRSKVYHERPSCSNCCSRWNSKEGGIN